MIDNFVEILINKINEYYVCYYEEAPNDAKFPYLVIPTMQLTPLEDGYSAIFDIEIYTNELSTISIEKIMDDLRDKLDGFHIRNDKIGFHLGFDNHLVVKSTEQDIIIRRITFTARIFKS